jgi:hypothetical protein
MATIVNGEEVDCLDAYGREGVGDFASERI